MADQSNDQGNNGKSGGFNPIGLCIGMGCGVCFGVAMGSIPLGLCMGMGVGLCFSAALGSAAKGEEKKDEDRKE